MPTIKLDGRDIAFVQGDTIIRAAHRAGIDIPHYCWHPGLSVAANCRMCLVEILPPPGQRPMRLDILRYDETKKDYVVDQKPKLQPACQFTCNDGMEVKSESSPHVAEARKQVQEYLLLNHPVDCPICDQAGECRLQDYWLEHGRYRKRMTDEIIHKPKGVSFGPTIVYDAERCIVCTRCVRFVDEIAKDPVLDKRERGNLGEIFVAPGRQLDNNYTFMTEHVCPVGALTTKDFRFKARVWFLRTARTVCQGCATGCNAYLDYDPRSQKVYRHRPRENEEVNKYWMCDIGMLSYRRAHEDRVTKPRVDGRVVSAKDALERARKSFAGVSGDQLGIVLSAQHCSEDNFALVTLAKTYIGAGEFFLSGKPHGKGDGILYQADHNPNTKGATEVASTTLPRPLEDLVQAISAGKITHVIALGAEIPIEASLLAAFGKLKGMVTIAAHEGPLVAASPVVLPATSWAEMDGTYVNSQGLAQKSERAIFPQGESRPAWEWASALAAALGYASTWTKLTELRKAMATEPTASLPPSSSAAQSSSPQPLEPRRLLTTTMIKFLNEYQVLVFGMVKILVMLGFFLNMAPLLVFAERRQSALIQDRVGPNRAVITVPGTILKGALATPPLLLAIILGALCYVVFPPNAENAGRGFWLAELATFLLWTNALILAGFTRIRGLSRNPLEGALLRMEDPRWIFFTGLAFHVVLAIAYAGLSGKNGEVLGSAVGTFGPGLLCVTLVLIAGYLGYAIPSGKVELRAAGLFHSIADALKAAFKEDFVPPNADKLLHALGPLISLFPALVTYAVIPFGDTVCFETNADHLTDFSKLVGQATRETCANGIDLQIVDMNVGILYLFAVAGTGIVGAAIAGWSSDNKWSLLGGLRAASQMVSYEVAMGLSIVGAFMVYGSPRLSDMVRWQDQNTWGIFVQPLAFFMFFAAAIAEQKRVPFDAPEGESEIIAGYFVEYSSFKWLMFYTGEYIEMVTSSALLVTIFLGGWSLPFLHRDGITMTMGDSVLWQVPMSHLTVTILQVLTFFAKVIVLSFGQIFIRWTVPRFRYDQIMSFGWKMLLPASIANIVVTGLAILVLNGSGPAVQSTLRVLADLSNFAIIAALIWVVVRFAMLLLSPVERTRFTGSTAAARTALRGGVKTEPMQA